jgi:type I restriction enzyme S subunit
MKKYDSYKDSGIDWIGDVPSHWESWKISHAFNRIGSGTTPESGNPIYHENGTINWLNTGDLNDGVLDSCSKKITTKALEDYSSLKLFPTGSLVMAMYGATIGKTAILNFETTTNQACCVFCDSSIIDLKFLQYWFIGNKEQIINLAIGGGQPNISQNILKDIRVWCPDYSEQVSLTQFLDYKTTQIDHLIAKKQQFIQLLEEESVAVINQAVTKGLDPSVPMKDSGIEWLGEIPEHWEVKRIKHLLSEPLKYGANESAEEENLDDPRYIRITDFGNDGKLKANTFKSLPYSKAENFLLSEGDILFARSGATVGKTFFFTNYKGIACFAGYLIKASCDRQLLKPEFLYEFTNTGSYNNWKQSIFQQSTIQNIGADKYNQLKIAIPPISEQNVIVEFLKNKSSEIELIINKTQQEIELLKEYKTALISEVVTGKVDVRNEKLNK